MKKSTRIIAELKRIAAANGGILKPEVVVQKARAKSSPLHSRFTWDDTEAAEQHRLWQARQLISVSVELIEGVENPVDVFVSLTPDRGKGARGYRVMTDVLSDKELKEQMLIDALNELRVFQQKYSRLKELSEVFRAVKRFRRKIR